MMDVSVIITTYNTPQWLQKAVWAWQAQDDLNFELLVADDGSGDATREMIESLAHGSPLPIRHLWHEDRGFRKCTILNQALAAARGEYVIISDGDCLPRPDFVGTHRALARPGRFLSGGYIKLPLQASRDLAQDDVAAGRFAQVEWLREHGFRRSRKLLLAWPQGLLATLIDGVTPTRPTWNGHNASASKHDLLMVNGFDERMQWGGLDRELGERLENAGVCGLQIRHRAICVHLDHGHEYVRQEAVEYNLSLREQTRRERRTWTEAGLVKGPPPLPAQPGLLQPVPASGGRGSVPR